MPVVTTTIALSNVSGFSTGNLTNMKLYLDNNSNDVFDGGDVLIGGTGAVSISGQTGTIIFTGWVATSTYNVILYGDVSNIDYGNGFIVSLPINNVSANGKTTLLNLSVSGSVTNAGHGKPNRTKGGGGGGGGGAVDLLLPSAQGVGGGGTGGNSTSTEGGGPPSGGSQGGGGAGGGDGGAP